MDQVRSQEGDGSSSSSSRATHEFYQVGQLGRSTGTDLSEADGAVLLMELLAEDSSPPVDDDVDRRLSYVIRSLEAEIGGGGGTATTATRVVDDGESWVGLPPAGEDDGGMLDEMLVDHLDGGYGGAAAFGYWPEVVAPPVGGWYVYTEGGDTIVGGYEARDQQYYYVDHGSVEQVYSPLWEQE